MDEFDDIKDNPFLTPLTESVPSKKPKKKKLISKIKDLKNKKKKLPKKIIINRIQKHKIPISIIIVLIVSILSFFITYKLSDQPNNQTNNQNNSSTGSNLTVTKLEKGNPEYETIIPENKDINDLGGWSKVSPTGSDPVYAYVDSINSIAINVSQQPLPDNFKKDTANQIFLLAKSFSADEKITNNELTFYIGNSTDGSQSIIFTKNNLLILIKSTAKINNDDWLNYIELLK